MTARRGIVAFFLLILASYPAYMRSVRPKPATPKPTPKVAKPAPLPVRDTTVQQWLRGMTLREKVGQLIVVPSFGEAPSRRSKDWRNFVHAVRDLRVGGIIVVNRVVGGSVRNAEPHAMAAFLNRMQRIAKVPLIAAGDFERGASMRVAGTAKFPHLMAYGAANDPGLTRELGAYTAKEARAMGIHWVFAPDADVNNNPDNPIINIRSFGEDPQLVSKHVASFIEGAHSDPNARILVTAKHFPGHGDTAVDSHMGLPVLNLDRARMDAIELVPFKAAVQAGVDSIMSAHMAVPAVDPEGVPATVSNKVLTGIIRSDLGFKGLIVTDAMDMAGLAKQYSSGEAAVRALEAGVDVLLMPPDPDAVVKSVLAAIKSGRLTEKRITESVTRILAAKVRVGLHRKKLVDLEDISDTIESDEFFASAQTAADRAVTVVKNEGPVLPLTTPANACFWVLSESRYGQAGRRVADEIRSRERGARVTQLDTLVPPIEIDDLLTKAGSCGTHAVMAFVSVAAYRGNVALGGSYPYLLEKLMASNTPVVLVALGNPYLLRSFPNVRGYMATFSTAPTAEVAAVKALFGEIATTGRMPVSIPGYTKVGDGMTVATTR
jgi:beta-N-acetylhexosaminidase